MNEEGLVKLWKKIICLPIALILLVQSSFIPTAIAQELPDPPDSGRFYFEGTDEITFVGTFSSRTTTVRFNRDANPSLTPDIVKRRIPDHSQYSEIVAFRLEEGGGSDVLFYDDEFRDRKSIPFLAVGKSGENYKNLGLYYCTEGTDSGSIPCRMEICAESNFPSIIEVPSWEKFKSIAAYMNNSGLGETISNAINGTDLASQCTAISVKWTSMKDLVRQIFQPMPDGAHESTNPNWSNDHDRWWDRVKSGVEGRNLLISNLRGAAEYVGVNTEYLDNLSTDVFNLTEIGASNGKNILNLAKELKTIVHAIKSSGEILPAPHNGTPEWPCGRLTPATVFKMDEGLRNIRINTLDELVSEIDQTVEKFLFFAGEMDAPVGGGGGVCDTGITDSGITAMIRQAFCALLLIMKEWADSFFDMALVFLKASLGVTKNADIDIPVYVDKAPPAGSAGTPDGTPAPSASVATTNTIQVPSQLNAPLTSQPSFPAKITLLDDSGGLTSTTMSGTVNVNKSTNPPTLNVSAQQTLESNKKYKVFFNAEEKCYRINLTPKGEGLEASAPALEKETACQIPTPSATPATPTSPGTENPAQPTPSTGSFSLTKEFAMDYVTYQQLNTGKSTAWVKVGPANYSTSADITGKLTLKSYNSQTSKITISVTLDNPPLSTWANIYVRGGVAKDTELFKFQTRPGEFTSN